MKWKTLRFNNVALESPPNIFSLELPPADQVSTYEEFTRTAAVDACAGSCTSDCLSVGWPQCWTLLLLLTLGRAKNGKNSRCLKQITIG